MISRADILEWQALVAPWPSSQLVEHNLILSRAICELYQNSMIREQLAFRGGTALHKLFFQQAGRFSEDCVPRSTKEFCYRNINYKIN